MLFPCLLEIASLTSFFRSKELDSQNSHQFNTGRADANEVNSSEPNKSSQNFSGITFYQQQLDQLSAGSFFFFFLKVNEGVLKTGACCEMTEIPMQTTH